MSKDKQLTLTEDELKILVQILRRVGGDSSPGMPRYHSDKVYRKALELLDVHTKWLSDKQRSDLGLDAWFCPSHSTVYIGTCAAHGSPGHMASDKPWHQYRNYQVW